MKKYNIILVILMLIIVGGVFYQTQDMRDTVFGSLGAAHWPRFIAIVLLIFTVLLLIQTIFSKSSQPSPLNFKSGGIKRVFALFGILIAFGITLPIFGFLLSSFLFIVVVMLVMGEKKKSWIIYSSVGITVGIYIIFDYLLKLMLPRPFFM
ncbi:MAG: tripartite tricarboxylate transporter TctB family protein [Spirochaetales bacterium]|nr:tripartite tricarboxylate transporter TctB family protein [Spirochaetales bacterium]